MNETQKKNSKRTLVIKILLSLTLLALIVWGLYSTYSDLWVLELIVLGIPAFFLPIFWQWRKDPTKLWQAFAVAFSLAMLNLYFILPYLELMKSSIIFSYGDSLVGDNGILVIFALVWLTYISYMFGGMVATYLLLIGLLELVKKILKPTISLDTFKDVLKQSDNFALWGISAAALLFLAQNPATAFVNAHFTPIVSAFIPHFLLAWVNLIPSIAPIIALVAVFSIAVLRPFLNKKLLPSFSRWALGLTGAVGLAIFVVQLPVIIRFFAHQQGYDFPDEVIDVIHIAWKIAILLFCTMLVYTPQKFTLLQRFVFVGCLAGALSTILLAYPVIMITYQRYLPGNLFENALSDWIVGASLFAAGFMIISSGPLACIWSQPASRAERFCYGLVSGMLAGGMIYGILLGPAAGFAAQRYLFSIATSSRQSILEFFWSESKLSAAINAPLNNIVVAFGILVIGCALLSGLFSLVTPSQIKKGPEKPERHLWMIPILWILMPVLFIGVVGAIAIALLFNQFALSRTSTWPVLLSALFPYLLWLIFQIIALSWLNHRQNLAPWQRFVSVGAFINGLADTAFSLLMAAIPGLFKQPWMLMMILPIFITGMGMLWTGRRLWKPEPTEEIIAINKVGVGKIFDASLLGILLINIAASPIFSILTNVGFCYAAIIAEIADISPPNKANWLQDIIKDIFPFHAVFFFTFMVLAVSVAFATKTAILSYPWGWMAWCEQRLQAFKLKKRLYPIASIAWRVIRIGLFISGIAFLIWATWNNYFSLFVVSVSILLVFAPRSLIFQDRWLVSALAVLTASVGITSLTFHGAIHLPTPSFWLSLIYLLFIGPAAVLMYSTLMRHTRDNRKPFIWLVIVIGASLVFSTASFISQDSVRVSGGTISYDGNTWQKWLSAEDNRGKLYNFRFFQPQTGDLWAGVGSGYMINSQNGSEFSLLSSNDSLQTNWSNTQEWEQEARRQMVFLHDQQGFSWVGFADRVGQLAFENGADHTLRVPGFPDFTQSSGSEQSSCAIGAVESILLDSGQRSLFFDAYSITDIQYNPKGDNILFETLDEFSASSSHYVLRQINGNLITELGEKYEEIPSAKFSATGNRITMQSNYRLAQIRDGNGAILIELPLENDESAEDIAISPNGQRLLTISSLTARLWQLDAQTAQVIGYQDLGSGQEFLAPLFSPDSNQLLIEKDRNIYLVDQNGQMKVFLAQNADRDESFEMQAKVFSPDGMLIATGVTGVVKIWDRNGNPIREFSTKAQNINSIADLIFSPDGSRLFVFSNTQVAVYSTSDWMLVKIFDLVGDSRAKQQALISRFAFFDGGWAIHSLGDRKVSVYDNQGNLIPVQESRLDRVASLAFSPDGNTLLIGGCLEKEHYVTLRPLASVSALAQAADSAIWVGTQGDGAYRIEPGRPLEDTRWQHFTTANSGLDSDTILAITATPDGAVWFGTQSGLSILSNEKWDHPEIPGIAGKTPVTTFLQDSRERMWVGLGGRVAVWDKENWESYEVASGPPMQSPANTLFEDSRGGIWVGTRGGTLRFDEQRWTRLVPTPSTVFAETPDGVIWVGGQDGLVRYSLDTGDQSVFSTSTEAAFPANDVQDLFVDENGDLWVSISSIDYTPGSTGWAITINLLFFGGISLYIYRGYQHTPQALARRLNHRMQAHPQAALAEMHQTLRQEANADQILALLPEASGYASLANRLQRAYSAKEVDLDAWLAYVDQLKVMGDVQDAPEIAYLYTILVQAGRLNSLPQLAAWPVRLVRSSDALHPMLVSEDEQPHTLSSLAGESTAEALEAMGQVAIFLSKYVQVEHSNDKLSYLADALGAVERAARQALQAQPPERRLLEFITLRWRELVSQELNSFSGQANLRLELRTRQVRRAERITITFQLKNVGRAAAENITVYLQASEDFTLRSESAPTLERLSADGAMALDFELAPNVAQSLRLTCQVTWDDRTASGRTLDFADTLSLYTLSEEFRPIPNPYVPGPPVKDTSMFMGREDIFRFIQENLRSTSQQRSLVLHGQRRTGKSSILYQLLSGRLGPDFIPVLVDMQEIAPLVENEGDFFAELADKIERAARKAGLAASAPDLPTFRDAPSRTFNHFLNDLEEILANRKILIMFDEFELIESLIEQGKLRAELLGYVRSLIQHRSGLVFIFTGTHRLEEMSRDYWSIFFNITLYQRVSFLNTDEAQRLIRHPVANALDVDDLVVEKMVALTHAHPYFLQLLCWALVNHANAQRRNYATVNDINDVLSEILASGEPYFAYIWQQAAHTERLALCGLAHAVQPGKTWVRPDEILEILVANGDQRTQRDELLNILDILAEREVLIVSREGALRYCFQIELLRQWIAHNKAVSILVERGA